MAEEQQQVDEKQTYKTARASSRSKMIDDVRPICADFILHQTNAITSSGTTLLQYVCNACPAKNVKIAISTPMF